MALSGHSESHAFVRFRGMSDIGSDGGAYDRLAHIRQAKEIGALSRRRQ